ncbi:hypothetical protein ANCDUO_01176 [Ancylostoma duodenale]|uniref:Uncharacterized protein n=1 Tax=Ancylostoma duodenale TaxID=51022 RepID=A0A0C2HA13_9BILA|nr:hypothetical protein ANCDUO_01176 [Ancylostoma duodenale]
MECSNEEEFEEKWIRVLERDHWKKWQYLAVLPHQDRGPPRRASQVCEKERFGVKSPETVQSDGIDGPPSPSPRPTPRRRLGDSPRSTPLRKRMQLLKTDIY